MKYLTLLIAFIVIAFPDLASAALVQCDGVSVNGLTECSACDFAVLGNTILKLLIGVLFVVFGVMAAIAGFGLVTSGGNPSAIQDAKSKLVNAFIGIIIVLAAWLLVDTIMRSLLIGGEGVIVDYGPWYEIECHTQRSTTEAVPGTSYGTWSFCATNSSGVENCVVGLTQTACQDASSAAVADGRTVTQTCSETPTAGTCSVTPLSPITDPLAQLMESGQRIIWDNTDPNLRPCVDKFIGLVGGSVTSVYRPPAYQAHLYEVSTKMCQLSTITDPACNSIRTPIEADAANHGLPLCGAVAQTSSTHSSGIGVDISGINNSSPSVQAAAASSCLNWRNYANDPYHYDLIGGCTCTSP